MIYTEGDRLCYNIFQDGYRNITGSDTEPFWIIQMVWKYRVLNIFT